jgi:hypothetical protein
VQGGERGVQSRHARFGCYPGTAVLLQSRLCWGAGAALFVQTAHLVPRVHDVKLHQVGCCTVVSVFQPFVLCVALSLHASLQSMCC